MTLLVNIYIIFIYIFELKKIKIFYYFNKIIKNTLLYPERQAIKMEKTNILNYIFLICLIDTFIGQYNGPAYIAHSTADCKVHTALHSLPIGHSTASTSWLYYFKIGLFCLIWIFVWLGIGLYICRFMRIVPAFVGF